MLLQWASFYLLHYYHDVFLSLKDFFDFYHAGVSQRFKNLQFCLYQKNEPGIILLFYNMLNGNDLGRIFILALVDRRVLARPYFFALQVLGLKVDILAL